MPETTDLLAVTVAENAICNLLDGLTDHSSRATARAVVGSGAAHFEYRDGLRRIVLTGPWEVDPRP